MLEASSVYFQSVNERAAHVKIDHVSLDFNLGCGIYHFSLCQIAFGHCDFMNENRTALGI